MHIYGQVSMKRCIFNMSSNLLEFIPMLILAPSEPQAPGMRLNHEHFYIPWDTPSLLHATFIILL